MFTKLTDTILKRVFDPHKPLVVAGYYPIGSEFNVVPLLQHFFGHHHTVSLPVTQHAVTHDDTYPSLVFWEWIPGSRTVKGKFNIPIPPRDQTVPVRPDVILTPLIAYDLAGRRLGYGGGFYDQTLMRYRRFQTGWKLPVTRIASVHSQFPIIACGIAYDDQYSDQLAHVAETHDALLDAVLTEKEVYICSQSLDAYLTATE